MQFIKKKARVFKLKVKTESNHDRIIRLLGQSNDVKHTKVVKDILTNKLPKVLLDIVFEYDNWINREQKMKVSESIPYMIYAAQVEVPPYGYFEDRTIGACAFRIRPEEMILYPLWTIDNYDTKVFDDDYNSFFSIPNTFALWERQSRKLERKLICPKHNGKCTIKSCEAMRLGVSNLYRSIITPEERADGNIISPFKLMTFIPLEEEVAEYIGDIIKHVKNDRHRAIDSYFQ